MVLSEELRKGLYSPPILSIVSASNVSFQMTKFLNEGKSKFYKIIQLRHPPKHPGKHRHRSHRGFDTEKVRKIFMTWKFCPIGFQSVLRSISGEFELENIR